MASSTSPKTKSFRVGVIGAETLLGKEFEEVFKTRSTGITISPYAANAEGNFSADDDAAVYVQALTPESMSAENAIIIAGTPEGALKASQLAASLPKPPVLIDCTGFLEQQPNAQIVLPLLENGASPASRLLVVAHPAAAAVAMILLRLSRQTRLSSAIIHVFEPASELGKRGINELHQQTTSLLAFKTLEKNVFGTQLAFNMLAQYGEDASAKLATTETRLLSNVASLLSKYGSGAVPMPSLRVLQAPVFHGYSLSFWVELESAPNAAQIEEALASAQIEVRAHTEEPPHPVGATGESGVIVGDIRPDENNSRAFWIFAAIDNMRFLADAAADLLTEIRKPVQ